MEDKCTKLARLIVDELFKVSDCDGNNTEFADRIALKKGKIGDEVEIGGRCKGSAMGVAEYFIKQAVADGEI